MQRKISIERLPKLDKVLRITFASIKKDFFEMRDEFGQLEEKVSDSLDVFRKRIDNFSDAAWKELRGKTDKLERDIFDRSFELEKQIRELSEYTEKFIKATNLKIGEWNTKIHNLDENSAKATEIGAELKNIQFLRTELERIKVINELIKNIEDSTLTKKEFEKSSAQLKKDIKNDLEHASVAHEIMQKKIEKEIGSERKEIDDKIYSVEEKVKANADSIKQDVENLKGAEKKILELKKEFEGKEKVLKVEIEALKKRSESEREINGSIMKISRAVEALALRMDKMEKVKVETKVSKVSAKKQDGMFKRFVDFLVEDVEEEKDKTLQEFDRKKGKFEIKEIKELKE